MDEAACRDSEGGEAARGRIPIISWRQEGKSIHSVPGFHSVDAYIYRMMLYIGTNTPMNP